MIDEAAFIERATRFVAELSGEEPTSINADTPLLETGLLDSIELIALLAFIEKQRGGPLPIPRDEGIPLDALACLRTAYRELVARDA